MTEQISDPGQRLSDIRQRTMNLLARREYSRAEIERKLSQAGYTQDEFGCVLDAYQEAGYISDRRFAAMHLRSRASSGYGPHRVLNDLRQKGVAGELYNEVETEEAPDWFELALEYARRKFREDPQGDYKRFSKHMRHMVGRGFSLEQARYALENWAQEQDD